MKNLIVAHYFDGRRLKGETSSFSPEKATFFIDNDETGLHKEVYLSELKAVYFVKNLEGNPKYRKKIDTGKEGFGKKVRIFFHDGETLVGYTATFSLHKLGFFITPNDPKSNNERIFVISKATDKIENIDGDIVQTFLH